MCKKAEDNLNKVYNYLCIYLYIVKHFITIKNLKTEVDIKWKFLLPSSILFHCGINFFGESNNSSISRCCFAYKRNSTTSTTNSGRIFY